MSLTLADFCDCNFKTALSPLKFHTRQLVKGKITKEQFFSLSISHEFDNFDIIKALKKHYGGTRKKPE